MYVRGRKIYCIRQHKAVDTTNSVEAREKMREDATWKLISWKKYILETIESIEACLIISNITF
jgi:hypothetical protein